MAFSLIWLPAILSEAGLKVAKVPGWETRGRSEMGTVLGVMCHHTAGSRNGNMPSLDLIVRGRSDLPGPLAQLGLGRDGTFYVIAAGRCNHAGKGIWRGLVNGNSNFIGIEAENTGKSTDPWPTIQVEAYQQGVAAILRHVRRGAEFCCGHKEYALPQGRKPDCSFDMVAFRSAVAALLNNNVPRLNPIPAVEPPSVQNNRPRRPTLRRGDNNEFVKELQRKLKLNVDGNFGAKTEAAMRVFQRGHNLVPDGIVGPKTWVLLDTIG